MQCSKLDGNDADDAQHSTWQYDMANSLERFASSGPLGCQDAQPHIGSWHHKIDVATYNTCAYARNSWPDAMKLLQRSLECSLRATVFSCSTALGACGQQGGWREAAHLLATSRAVTLAGSLVTKNGAINTCAKGKQWFRVMEHARFNSM
eukprot:symbB.v1.2.000290.t1/scaffold24.1/size427761/6